MMKSPGAVNRLSPAKPCAFVPAGAKDSRIENRRRPWRASVGSGIRGMRKKRVSGHGRSVTLAEVARLAKVSEITVSRILRNKGPIAQYTRERVMAAVREVGYLPNRLAGGLASSG